MATANTTTIRDSWGTRWGFILACVGSAVGMGNVWLFPTRVSALGGGSFILPYIIFVAIIGFSGCIGEMAFGRTTRKGPVGAFAAAIETRGASRDLGRLLGSFTMFVALATAIGYSVVVGWITKYMVGSFTGTTLAPRSIEEFGAAFGATAPSAASLSESFAHLLAGTGNMWWQILGLIICFGIMVFGIAQGIEKANKFMIPLFFLMFAGLAVYMLFQPGSIDGYRYIFRIDAQFIMQPMTWAYALGQAFFSLSLAGNGTVIYGSYLSDEEDVVEAAGYVSFISVIAAILASLVVIPAMATAGEVLSQGGPGLLFIFLPNVFAAMPGGSFLIIIFFIAVFFAAMTSLVNLYEAPIATLQEELGLSRAKATAVIAVVGLVASLVIQGVVEGWMDLITVYLVPIGAAMAGITFAWVMGSKRVQEAVSMGRKKPVGTWFIPLYKYVFCLLTLIVLALSILIPGGVG